MPKGKPQTVVASSMRSQAIKAILFILVIALGVYFFISMDYPLEITQTILRTRISGVGFSPKIIPADLNDSELDGLPPNTFSYLTMIDAGSSGCRAHVYRYGLLGSEKGSLYIVPQHVSKKVKPGLSSFAKNPTAAGESLTGLIDFLKSAIPPSEWENTPIWLKATAGLRMLQRDESANILMSVREFLGDKSKSPFLFRLSWAKVIPGTEEGAFGWMAVNYLYKVIGPKRVRGREPYAVVEMGGASSQVTQMAPDAREAGLLPADYKFVFTIESEQYSLYTHSYLGYGGEQARESVNKALLPGTDSESEVKDPCLNTGYVREKGQSRRDVYEGPAVPVKVVGVAGGLTNGCFDLASKTLFPAEEQAQSCTSPAPRSFGCVFQPDFVSRAKNFLVFENFFYVASGVGLKPAGHGNPGVSEKTKFPLKTSPQEYLDSSVEVCSTSWSSLATEFPRDAQPKDFNTKMCFATSYAAAFLVNGLGLPREKLITVQKEVAGSEIEWALGAAYKEALDFFGTEKMLRGTGTVATKYS